MNSIPAPVADWVTIPELYRDPFPIYERLRAEGGVHWVPAVGRYLITSYEAVHATELDQEVFSANEEGSLMLRSMGHSMLRRDDPEHYIERKAWQPSLQPRVVKRVWTEIFARAADRYLGELAEKGPGADLVRDFAGPYAAECLRELLGFHNVTQQDMQRWSQTLIDATGNYADDPDVWAAGERSFEEVDDALDEMLVWHAAHLDDNPTLIAHLLALPGDKMPLDRIRANMKMTIGGGLNEPRDAIAVGAWALLLHPEQRAAVEADPSLWPVAFEETIRWVAPIGMYSRQVTRDTVLTGVELPAKARLGICVLSANRDEQVWDSPERFDIHREVKPHLAFGKGTHVCLGTWVARAEVAEIALPALFSRFEGLSLVPDRPAEAGGWVFRGMTRLPVQWDAVRGAGSALAAGGAAVAGLAPAPGSRPAPRIAVVGSGPSGAFTAQALRRRIPDCRVDVFEALPVPFGLVRYGVAADHQGTKAVARQFERLFADEAVRFIGNTRVVAEDSGVDTAGAGGTGAADAGAGADAGADAPGAEVPLDELRSNYDAVVLATGLHADAPLAIPGADLPGVHGAGSVTRWLNGHPDAAEVPALGETVAVIGHGNVALDVARLIARDDFEGSDIDDAERQALAGSVRTIHLIGRSVPTSAKFDPVMVRELAGLPGVGHAVHGVDFAALPGEGKDARADAVRLLASFDAARGAGDAERVRIEWWFGAVPLAIEGADRAAALRLRTPEGETSFEVDDVITAIGFRADAARAMPVEPGQTASGRVEPGLYVAGWLRRGPRGTIPDQREDARQLARLIAEDIDDIARERLAAGVGVGAGASGADPSAEPVETRIRVARSRDLAATGVERSAASVDFAGWRRIDLHERAAAAPGRVRAKLRSRAALLAIAGAPGTPLPEGLDPVASAHDEALPVPLTIAYATESGGAQFAAEELRAALAGSSASADGTADIALLDLAEITPAGFDPERFHVILCSTYGDGELPTGVRGLVADLAAERPDLGRLAYAVFGLGDRSYEKTYSRGSELFDEALAACGARRVGEYGRHDAGGGTDAAEAAAEWFEGLREEIRALYALA